MFGAMHMDGQLHHMVSESDSRRSPESFCELVKSHLSRLEATMGYRPLGCGVSMSGLVCNGRVERSLQVGPWAGVDLKDSLEASLGLSVIVENDNRCSTFSLNWFQLTEASKNRSLLVLGLGEGISTALCFGHEPLVGSRGAAGEIGHIPIHQNGKVCSCGKYDCLEAYCSSGQVLKELQRLHPDKLLMTSVDQIYHETQRYPGLLAGVDRVAQDLCRVILPIIASLDLERLVLISESLSYSELVSTALDRHMDQKLVGHECQGLRWKAFGDLSEHRLKGVGGLVLREAFLAGGKV
jgi:predicted NBD/HSP70 family sugar kinase